jgi:hypothetical protein
LCVNSLLNRGILELRGRDIQKECYRLIKDSSNELIASRLKRDSLGLPKQYF